MGGTVIHEPDAEYVLNESVVEQQVGFPMREECTLVKRKEDGGPGWSW